MDIYGFYRGDAFDAYGYLGAHLTEKVMSRKKSSVPPSQTGRPK